MTQKIINTAAWTYGPYDQVITLVDRYVCIKGNDTLEMQFDVIGESSIDDAPEGYAPPLTWDELWPLIAAFIKKVDADTDAIYAAVIGNRGPEYEQAKNDANAFKDAGYAGDVPRSVQSWATAKGWTAQEATIDILAAASRLSDARDLIRENRLQVKESARNVDGVSSLETVKKTWESFLAEIKADLGIT